MAIPRGRDGGILAVEDLAGDWFDWSRVSDFETMPRLLAQSGAGTTSGTMYGAAGRVRADATFTQVRMVASTVTPNTITGAKMAVWSATLAKLNAATTSTFPVLRETGDVSAQITAAGVAVTGDLASPLTVARGDLLIVGAMVTGTTLPGWRGATGVTAQSGASPALAFSKTGWTAGAAVPDLVNPAISALVFRAVLL